MNDYRPVDPAHVLLEEDGAISYWTKELECTEQELRAAIKKCGAMYGEIKAYISYTRRGNIRRFTPRNRTAVQ